MSGNARDLRRLCCERKHFLCSSFRRKPESILTCSSTLAKTDSRPCVSRRPSMADGHFLLLVQEKVTKENTPSAPRRSRSERCATGGRVWPRGHPWPLGQIGAIPRAARVRCTRLFRPPFARL